MKKFLLILIISALCVTAVFGMAACNNNDDLASIRESGKMVIGITYYEPMNYFNEEGVLVGFDTEFAQAVCKELGVEAVFQEIDWNTKEVELEAKTIDVIWNGLTITEERKEKMDFSKPYLINKQVAVINKKDAAKFTSIDSIKNALVTCESGSAGETVLKELGCTKITGKQTQKDALMELKAGTCDVAVLDATLATASTGEGTGYSELQIAQGIELQPERYAIGYRKGSNLKAEIDAIIDKFIEDGTLAAIAAKYDLTDRLVTE